MALDGTYAGLKASALDWMARNDQSSVADDWVKLAEARLNAVLDPMEQDTTLTGTIGSRFLSTSALSLVEPIALWFTPSTDDDEIYLQPQSIDRLTFGATNAQPAMWAFDTNAEAIKLDCPCDVAYSFRLRFRGKLALAMTEPNWLLTNRPDIYLAATMMWGAGYNSDVNQAAVWKGILDEGIAETRRTLARAKKGTLRVDPALTANSGIPYNYQTGF